MGLYNCPSNALRNTDQVLRGKHNYSLTEWGIVRLIDYKGSQVKSTEKRLPLYANIDT